MGKINRFLMMLIAMVAIMIAAVGIDRGMQFYNTRKWEKERVARYEQAYADVADIEMTIRSLSQDQEALEAFIEEHRDYFEDLADYLDEEAAEIKQSAEEENLEGTEGMGFWGTGREDVSGNRVESVSGNVLMDVSGNLLGSISGSALVDVSGNLLGGISGSALMDVSGNLLGSVSGNMLMDVSGNLLGSISGNSLREMYGGGFIVIPADPSGIVSGNTLNDGEAENGENDQPAGSGQTLLEKRKVCASYMETRKQNSADRRVIAESNIDFSQISITCLGDSITEAANLSDLEDYQQYSYPARLKEILGAEKMTNLGIGGSSVGRYWDNAFVDRYKEIPEDTDLIIVMGGTNDGFCMDQEELGTMEERKPRTFIGDLDELMRGLKENYPDARVVFVTPLPNILHDILRKEKDYLLPQTAIVNAMKFLAQEYEIPVIDLYNSNILDTHDAAIIYNYMPDGVHCNSEGYQLLAEHLAAELIRLYEKPQVEEAEE